MHKALLAVVLAIGFQASDASAQTDSSIQSLVQTMSTQASSLSQMARQAHPSLAVVFNKSTILCTTTDRLSNAINRDSGGTPDNDTLQRLLDDGANLCLAVRTPDQMTTGDLANIAAIADDIQTDASDY